MGRKVVVMREPGGVDLSERIRALVKDPGLVVGGRAEALLYAAHGRSSSRNDSSRGWRQVTGCCSIASWIPHWPTRGRPRLGMEAIAALSAFATGGP
jgi:dTMP kinase